ncbi:MAG: EsaB/YukD family protein [Clostridia bacterium]|nr:EsaB/YukD family protein [Clostridia bacterium]
MSESVIVTVRIGGFGQEADMELPSDVEVGVLSIELLRALKAAGVDSLMRANNIYLYCGNRRLQDNKTLTQNRIYDGSIITITY